MKSIVTDIVLNNDLKTLRDKLDDVHKSKVKEQIETLIKKIKKLWGENGESI